MMRVLSRRSPDVLAPPNAARCIWPSNGSPGKSLRYVQAPAPCHPQLIDLRQIGRCEG